MSHFHDALGLEISCACAAAALFFDFLTPDDIWAPRGRARRGPFQERASPVATARRRSKGCKLWNTPWAMSIRYGSWSVVALHGCSSSEGSHLFYFFYLYRVSMPV